MESVRRFGLKSGLSDSIKLLPPMKISRKEREGARRKKGYKFDSRGLIHQTQQMNCLRGGIIRLNVTSY